jgi:hypothetical protein
MVRAVRPSREKLYRKGREGRNVERKGTCRAPHSVLPITDSSVLDLIGVHLRLTAHAAKDHLAVPKFRQDRRRIYEAGGARFAARGTRHEPAQLPA